MSAEFSPESFEFEMSMSYDDEFTGFDDYDDDDFDYDEDETLDDFDEDSDFYDEEEYSEEEVDDSYEPFDDVEPESGYSFKTHAAEELIDEDDALFEEDDGEDY